MLKYVLLVNLYAALLYGLYYITLRKKLNHQWSRGYLLLCSLLPFIIPFISITTSSASLGNDNPFTQAFQNLEAITIMPSNDVNNIDLFLYAYFIIAGLLLLRLFIQVLGVLKIIKNHPKEINNAFIWVKNTQIPVSSFFKYVFTNGDFTDPLLLAHEQRHVELRHSYDILFLRILSCFGFFNILLPSILKSLKIVHEYQADIVGKNVLTQYQNLMLEHQFDKPFTGLMHSFSVHPLQLRIKMLKSKKPLKNNHKIFMILGLISVTSIGVWAQSQEPLIAKTQSSLSLESETKVEDTLIHKNLPNKANPEYNWIEYLQKTLQFPKDFRSDRVKISILIEFVIEKDGTITNIAPIRQKGTINGLASTTDQNVPFANEAIRVIQNAPNWQPASTADGKAVRSYMTLPISFKANL